MDREDRPLLSRYREARRRAEKLRGLRELLPEAREREETIARLERQIERLDRARRARVAELRGRREEAREELAGLPDVPGEELERWRTLSVRAASHGERIEELEDELREAREAHREEAAEAARARERSREAAARRERLEEGEAGESGLEERAREHLRAGAADETGESSPRRDAVLAGVAIVLALLLGAAVVTDLLPGWAGSLGALAGAALAAWLGVRRRRLRRRKEARRERAARLLREADALGLEVESAEEIPAAAERARREADRAEQRLEMKELEAKHAEERVEELREALESARSELRSMEKEMEDLASLLDVDSLPEAEETGRRRADLEGRIRTLEGALTELAGADPAGWGVEAPSDADGLPEWDGERRARLEGELEQTRREYREMRDEFVQAGLATPEDALTELESCLREMEDMERGWAAGRLAGEIFARMDESLERRLSGVLEADGPFSAAAMTERITGRYVSLSRTDDGELSVRDGRGRRFAVAELSRGTRDQIYLALRIGLGGAALKSAGVGDGGFFLLDDAFLTADWSRRERLVEAAADLAEAGWQLVYLTCDDHLKELFVEAGAALHELDRRNENDLDI
jgi:DNA repair exonuclease SbcCD ATPase subunit